MTDQPLFERNDIVIQSANKVLTEADSGKLFVCDAAVAFDLPSAAAGMVFEFSQTANSLMSVASGDSNIVGKNSTGITTVTFDTANNRIGAACAFVAVEVSAGQWAWLLFLFCTNTVTLS